MSKLLKSKIKKVLILGSGALKIGEAGEFDYSGSQAIKSLKEEGIKTVLINPNIATVQTDNGFADKVYFLPVKKEFVEEVIKKEKIDSILLNFGGQTALNCGLELEDSGILKQYNVKVLGTSTNTIRQTEDRDLFKQELKKINIKTPESKVCTTIKSGFKAAKAIGYPVMIRAAFTLGGQGSGFADNEKELEEILEKAFSFSPQVLVEENLKGWKEIEYEVVRDCNDNCITVCNMENFDPLGIHTGESIVVAPSQTLTNSEYHKLRNIAIDVIKHLGIIGECNIQYAFDPKSEDYRVIEVNARLSRSSALASKATGYPLAYVAAKLCLGFDLTEIKNSITKKTIACFEPALDYVVLKFPRWDLEKFEKVKFQIGSEMKSVGEVMAIGRCFEEVFQKAIRMISIGAEGFVNNISNLDFDEKEISHPTHRRIFTLEKALLSGISVESLHDLSKIDIWFLEKLKNITDLKPELKNLLKLDKSSQKNLLYKAKKLGFSDKQIAFLVKKDETTIRKLRHKLDIVPVVKQIDTLAGEFPAKTNYLYTTYSGTLDDISFDKKKTKKILILGSGAYRIGSSVEFDWCCVNSLKTLNKMNYETIMLNYNPETVSTDYDICDKLYFDEISLEKVLDIYKQEKPDGVIISMGGQIPNNLALELEENGIKILGTHAKNIDQAENRNKFSALLDKLKVNQPVWSEVTSFKDAVKFANKVSYPVLIRPSYVLSGAAMRVCTDDDMLTNFLEKAAKINKKYPVVISKFEENCKEIEFDAVAKNGVLKIYAISEHVENAGVHSGDATIVLPPQKLYLETIRKIKKITKQIAKELNITGPFNIQFLAKQNHIKVIECNLRASRSFPFVSKVTKYNFIDKATRAIMGENIDGDYKTIDLDYVGIKAPQFSFSRLKGADPRLGVEMASTGEVATFGDNKEEALLKSLIATGFKTQKKNILITIGKLEEKIDFLKKKKKLIKAKFKLFATKNTSKFLKDNDVENSLVYKVSERKNPNILELIKNKKFDLVINTQTKDNRTSFSDGYTIRRKAIDSAIPLVNNIKVAKLLIDALTDNINGKIHYKSWDEY